MIAEPRTPSSGVARFQRAIGTSPLPEAVSSHAAYTPYAVTRSLRLRGGRGFRPSV